MEIQKLPTYFHHIEAKRLKEMGDEIAKRLREMEKLIEEIKVDSLKEKKK